MRWSSLFRRHASALPGLILLAALPVVLVLTSCSGNDAKAAATPPPGGRGAGGGGAVPVTTAVAVQKPMPVNLHVVGNVETASTVEVRAQVTGALLTVEFSEGQEVKAGDLLFTLDPRPFETALQQAQAVLAKDTGQSKTAETQRARYRDLLAKGLVSQADFDTVSATANALQGTINVDNAQVETAKLQLQYTKIAAPVSGRTGALLVHQGALVRSTDASPLVVINQIAPVYVSFAVPARMLADVRNGRSAGSLRVEAVVPGSRDAASTGSVTFIDNAVDPATDTIRLKGTFANTDRRLWPGQFVNVTLQLAVEPHAVVIPAEAVQPSQQGSSVYVVKPDQTVEARTVQVSRTEGQDSVIASGIRAGDVVVIDGQLGLTPGARVSVKAAAGEPKKVP